MNTDPRKAKNHSEGVEAHLREMDAHLDVVEETVDDLYDSSRKRLQDEQRDAPRPPKPGPHRE